MGLPYRNTASVMGKIRSPLRWDCPCPPVEQHLASVWQNVLFPLLAWLPTSQGAVWT